MRVLYVFRFYFFEFVFIFSWGNGELGCGVVHKIFVVPGTGT